MKNTQLYCFYYPTTVTLIDDDQIFLENLAENLSDKIPYQRFDSPQEALTFLQSQQGSIPASQDFLQASIDSEEDFIQPGKSVVNINLSENHNKLYNRKRFSITSVIVVDHDMPGMNGINFCKKLTDSSIKKIMLTGAADHKIAIKAFNDGIIHKFIMKDDPNVFENIDKAIFHMQQEYFFDLSKLVISNIKASTFSYLGNAKFVAFFLDLIKKNFIVEYYLIDQIGSFLLVNTNGELLWFIVKSKQDMINDSQIAVDQNASPDIIKTLNDRNKLLFLFSHDDFKQSVEMWPSYLYPANTIETLEGCYYALINGEEARNIGGINKNNLYSYNHFLF